MVVEHWAPEACQPCPKGRWSNRTAGHLTHGYFVATSGRQAARSLKFAMARKNLTRRHKARITSGRVRLRSSTATSALRAPGAQRRVHLPSALAELKQILSLLEQRGQYPITCKFGTTACRAAIVVACLTLEPLEENKHPPSCLESLVSASSNKPVRQFRFALLQNTKVPAAHWDVVTLQKAEISFTAAAKHI